MLRSLSLIVAASLLGCIPTYVSPPAADDVEEPADPGQLLRDDFSAGRSQWTDWHDSPGWIRVADESLVIETAVADHEVPIDSADETFTFGALAAHCPRTDEDGRCLDPADDGWEAYTFDVDANVRRQLREPGEDGTNLPASWETAWLFFRFQDTRHYYYVLFLTHHERDLDQDYGGFEIGKYNCPDDCGVFNEGSGKETLLQITAVDVDDEDRKYLAHDRWYHWRIEVENVVTEAGEDAVAIAAYLDDELVGSILDDGDLEPVFGGDGPTPPLLHGGLGLYGEDCEAWFDDVSVRRLGAPEL